MKRTRDYYNIYVWGTGVFLIALGHILRRLIHIPDMINIAMIAAVILIHVYLMMELLVHQINNKRLKRGWKSDLLAISTLFFAFYIFPVYWFIYLRK